MKDISWFTSICADNGLVLNREQEASFEKYRELLAAWNSSLNLISRKDEENFYPAHILNSIAFLFKWKLKSDGTILDLGTGGGLPGIPLKILLPETEITLVDSIAKKTSAVSEMVRDLQLQGVTVLTSRAEELSKGREYQRRFDYVVSRAAGKLDLVVRWSRGFLKKKFEFGNDTIPGGTLLVLKGGDFSDELARARNLKFVDSVDVRAIRFERMDEMSGVDKKIVLVNFKDDAAVIRRSN